MTDPSAQPYPPPQPYQPGYPVQQQYSQQQGYPAQPGYPPQGYPPYQQQYAPPRKERLKPTLWVALGALVLAVVMTLDGDTTPVLNAQTPLAIGLLAALVAAVMAVVTLLTSQRGLVWPALILAFGLIVVIWAGYDIYRVHEALDQVQQCFQDLSSC